jgi:hypothetical protein
MATEERAGSQSLRPLTKSELDRSLQRLADELTLAPDAEEGEPASLTQPRWISAAELVRRVAPFTGRN